MMREEFEALTGIYLDENAYHQVEKTYMELDVDKVEFCRRYKANEDGLAQKIQRGINNDNQKCKTLSEEKDKQHASILKHICSLRIPP